VLARRRRGLETLDMPESEEQLHREPPRETGSMAEGVGSAPMPQHAAGVLSAAVSSQRMGSSTP
jgi:hypothetical protein